MKKKIFKYSFLIVILVFLMFLFFNPSNKIGNGDIKDVKISDKEKNNVEASKKFVRKDKSILKVCQSEYPPPDLNPITFIDKREEITFNIFDRLVKWDEKGNIIPDLAESYKRLNDNTYQFKLRKNVFFHNGEEFNADCVKFSIERILDPKTKSPGYDLFQSISKIDVIDPFTINISTLKPDYLFIRKMSLVEIIPEKYFKEVGSDKFGKHPIGTSAYKFKSWENDGSIVLIRNDNYWGEHNANIETIIFKFIKTGKLSRQEQLDALFNGEVDLITQLPGIHSFKVQKHPRTKVIKLFDQPKVYKLLFNSLKKPFNDVRVRKAVNMALNRDVLIRVLAKGNGRKLATNTINVEFGHNPYLKPYPYEPKTAKALLKEAGYKKIDINIVASDESETVAMAVVKDLEKIKISARVDVIPKEKLAKNLSMLKIDKSKKWVYDLAIYSGNDPLLHVGYLYGQAVYSKGYWSTTYNKEFDKKFEELTVTLNKEEQFKKCQELEEIAYNNYWYTPIYQIIGTYGAAKDLNLKTFAIPILDLKEANFENIE